MSLTLDPGNLKAGSFDGTAARTYFAVNALRMLHEPVFGTYASLYAGLSPDLKIEHNGTDVTPRGMRRPDSEITRKDILAMAQESEGGLGYRRSFGNGAKSSGNLMFEIELLVRRQDVTTF